MRQCYYCRAYYDIRSLQMVGYVVDAEWRIKCGRCISVEVERQWRERNQVRDDDDAADVRETHHRLGIEGAE